MWREKQRHGEVCGEKGRDMMKCVETKGRDTAKCVETKGGDTVRCVERQGRDTVEHAAPTCLRISVLMS